MVGPAHSRCVGAVTGREHAEVPAICTSVRSRHTQPVSGEVVREQRNPELHVGALPEGAVQTSPEGEQNVERPATAFGSIAITMSVIKTTTTERETVRLDIPTSIVTTPATSLAKDADRRGRAASVACTGSRDDR